MNDTVFGRLVIAFILVCLIASAELFGYHAGKQEEYDHPRLGYHDSGHMFVVGEPGAEWGQTYGRDFTHVGWHALFYATNHSLPIVYVQISATNPWVNQFPER